MRNLPPVRRGSDTTVRQMVPVVRETVTVEPITQHVAEQRTTDIGKDPASWSAADLQAYVVRRIEDLHGPFPKNAKILASTFRSFHGRHGEWAGPIAVAAFELHRGYWMGAPISTNRFCKGSDQYFADRIKAALTA